MFPSFLKLSIAAAFISLSSLSISSLAAAQAANQTTASSRSADAVSAQSVPGQTEKIPQPGELGSPFSVDHFWSRIAFELSGGYAPVVKKGTSYFDKGFNVTAGVIDHLSPSWKLMAEVQFFPLRGNTTSGGQSTTDSNVVFALDMATSYDLLRRASTSPYLIGGVGYYNLPTGKSCSAGICDPQTSLNNAKAIGYNGGIGVRHRLYYGKRMAVFAEGRYHYIASGSTSFGQVSLFPVTAGIRW